MAAGTSPKIPCKTTVIYGLQQEPRLSDPLKDPLPAHILKNTACKLQPRTTPLMFVSSQNK